MMDEDYPNISEAYDVTYETSVTRLSTCTLEGVYEKAFAPKTPIIDSLLYPGTYLLVGSSKVGKSFLVEQIAFHVARGDRYVELQGKQRYGFLLSFGG